MEEICDIVDKLEEVCGIGTEYYGSMNDSIEAIPHKWLVYIDTAVELEMSVREHCTPEMSQIDKATLFK